MILNWQALRVLQAQSANSDGARLEYSSAIETGLSSVLQDWLLPGEFQARTTTGAAPFGMAYGDINQYFL